MLVTANYKLSFDTLRFNLQDENLWLLVVDTRGINVWCGAGKGSFSADESALQVKRSNLDRIVTHRELIFPSLGLLAWLHTSLSEKAALKGSMAPFELKILANS